MFEKITKPNKRVSIKLGPSYILPIIKLILIINLVIFVITLMVYPFIQPKIPLFFSLVNPQNHLAEKLWLFLLPTISLAINIIHIQSLKLIDSAHEFIIRFFIYIALVMQIILLMITLRNILVVFKPF